jgi:hypothetical protein
MERSERLTDASAPAQTLDRSYIDWSAILAGAVVAAAIAALFTAFGAALGLSAISAVPGDGSISFAVILTGLWFVITLVASYMTGGYIAGRMRRRVDQATADEVSVRDGINGLVVWGVGILVGAVLLTNAATSTISTVGSAAETAVTAAGSAAGGVAEGVMAAAGNMLPDAASADPMAFINDTMLRSTSVNPAGASNADLARETSGILGNVLATGEITDEDRAYLESAVAACTGLTPTEVTARVDAAIEGAQSARAEAERLAEEARQTAIEVAETARISAVLTAFLLAASALVAAAAATVGAVRGGVHRDEGRVFGGLSYQR